MNISKELLYIIFSYGKEAQNDDEFTEYFWQKLLSGSARKEVSGLVA